MPKTDLEAREQALIAGEAALAEREKEFNRKQAEATRAAVLREGKDKALTDKIERLTAEIDDLQATINANVTILRNQDGQINTKSARVDALVAESIKQQQKIEGMSDERRRLMAEAIEQAQLYLASQRESIDEQIGANTKIIEDQTAKIHEANTRLTELKAESHNITEQIATLKDDRDKQRAAGRKELADLTAQKQAIETRIEAVSKLIDEAERQHATLLEDNKKLAEANETFKRYEAQARTELQAADAALIEREQRISGVENLRPNRKTFLPEPM